MTDKGQTLLRILSISSRTILVKQGHYLKSNSLCHN